MVIRPRPRRGIDRAAREARAAQRRGFTLIELLVVVAIISILASIAVPNFLEAQTRAKTARVMSDMRTLVTALESYAVDYSRYPPRHSELLPDGVPKYYMPEYPRQRREMGALTTPVAYVTSLPVDIFDKSSGGERSLIEYMDPAQASVFVQKGNGTQTGSNKAKQYWSTTNWLLLSVGPDGYIGVKEGGSPGDYPKQALLYVDTMCRVYDPSNGTTSSGNVFRFQSNENPALRLAWIKP
ncbi:MAG: type II secretion system protein [Candidatus Sumerlaeota bacterium]|nr:type II secretion system protein [Candidatus Sumerlaeota bacterium]